MRLGQTPISQESRPEMPMGSQMQTIEPTRGESMVCAYCGKRASFGSPIGALCTTDALLLGAVFHEWIPTHLVG